MQTETGLLCPKCRGQMRNYDRSGILVDQCEDCRGIFLDRGELERLIEAEGGGWSGRVEPPATLPQSLRDRGAAEQRRRESRIGNLLDLFGGD